MSSESKNLHKKTVLGFLQRIKVRFCSLPPDFVVGGIENPYLLRWWVIPRNRFLNIYLHCFMRSDDDRALHDHPWVNCSILVEGEYTEHTIADGGIHKRRVLKEGAIRFRWTGRLAHRVELHKGYCWTLFLTGPRYRSWGFHCPEKWVHWRDFTTPGDKGTVGAGCGDGVAPPTLSSRDNQRINK